MKKVDMIYRGFKNYKNETKHSELKNERKEFLLSNPDKDVLNSTKYLIIIQEDWILAIEKGLEFVEKAIAEERQFIRTNGETVPIEKVKKVSKDSVKHLAKHSEYITHVPDDPEEDVVPDKIYIVEKLSDYAVYENRFLYMMLCFLRDFIQIRIEKIEEIRRTYEGNLYFNKELDTKKRTLNIEVKLFDRRTDNPYSIPNEETEERIVRIKNCQQIVNSYLNCSLMREVSKSPMIKPPVVKTNVLKMNNNFKNALACYEYIASYQGKGYSVEEIKKNLIPLNEEVGDELMETISLLSFLLYKDGNELDAILEANYLEEEERRKQEEERILNEKIQRLKKLAKESNMSMEEYMVLLEKKNQSLLKDSEELTKKKNEIFLLNQTIEELNLEKNAYNQKIIELNDSIAEKLSIIDSLNKKYVDDITALNEQHRLNIENINNENEIEKQKLNEKFAADQQSLINKFNEDINKLRVTQFEEIQALNEEKQKIEEKINEKEKEKQQVISDCHDLINKNNFEIEEKRRDYESKNNELIDQNILYRAELKSLKYKNGTIKPNEDYTSREKFLELEEEFKAFNDYFEKQWAMTKKQIKKEIFNKK